MSENSYIEKISDDNIRPHTDNNFEDNNNNNNNNGNNGDFNEYDDVMTTISTYTEANVFSGRASEMENERENDLEQGIEPPPVPPKYKFFSVENKGMRMKFLKQYSMIIICFWLFILGVWSIYWGAPYNRQNRYINLSVLVAVEDDVDAPISKALKLASENPFLHESAGWIFKSNISETEAINLVHDQTYWGAIYVTSNNVSKIITDAFENGTNITDSNLVKSYFETGRDPNGMTSIVEPAMYLFGTNFQTSLQSDIYPSIINNLTQEQFNNLKDTNVLNSYPVIQYTDGRIINTATEAPLQIGLIYMIIITFFQILWTTPLNGMIAQCTVTKDYIIYRMAIAQISFLLISLAYSCLNVAFQIYMNNAWKGGFGVFWMVSYLAIAAVGGANENASLILVSFFPPLLGFWLLFFVIINITATFSPIPVCPEFYRFTYAMPIKNAYELMKVILYDTSRHNIGREFGILIAWVVLNNLLMPLCLALFATRMKKKIMKEQKEKHKK